MLKIGLTALLLLWLLARLDLSAMKAAFVRLSAPAIGSALLLVLLQHLVLAWRWHRIVKWLGGTWPLKDSLRWVLVGLFFNQALPTGVGGDAVRIWALRRAGQPASVAVGSVIAERGTGLVVLCLIVIAGILAGPPSLIDAGPGHALITASATLAGLLASLAVADHWLTRWLPARWAEACDRMAAALRSLFRSPRAFSEILVGGILATSLGLGAAVVLGHALGLQYAVTVYFALVGAAVLLTLLPISLGGWGVREAGMVALFGHLGSPAEPVMALSLVWALLPLVIALPGGMLFWFSGDRGTPARDSGDSSAARPSQ